MYSVLSVRVDLAFNNDLNRDLLKNLKSTINETSVPFGSKLTSLLLSLMVVNCHLFSVKSLKPQVLFRTLASSYRDSYKYSYLTYFLFLTSEEKRALWDKSTCHNKPLKVKKKK